MVFSPFRLQWRRQPHCNPGEKAWRGKRNRGSTRLRPNVTGAKPDYVLVTSERNRPQSLSNPRDSNENAIEKTIGYCRKQISIAANVAQDMKREFPNSELPSHVGYKQLTIILEKKKHFNEVIELCRQAQAQGWNGDWEKRILRSKKKLPK